MIKITLTCFTVFSVLVNIRIRNIGSSYVAVDWFYPTITASSKNHELSWRHMVKSFRASEQHVANMIITDWIEANNVLCSGIDFTKRLPCGDFEKMRKSLMVFFTIRRLWLEVYQPIITHCLTYHCLRLSADLSKIEANSSTNRFSSCVMMWCDNVYFTLLY